LARYLEKDPWDGQDTIRGGLPSSCTEVEKYRRAHCVLTRAKHGWFPTRVVDLWFASRTIVAKGGLFGRIHHSSTGAETLYERRVSMPTSSLEPDL
jgi:hypothetical protein